MLKIVKTFHLTRYFSVLSFVLIVLAGATLDIFLRQQEVTQLKRMAEDRNVAMTQVFRNALWQEFAPMVADTSARPADELRRQAAQRGLYEKAALLMRDSDVIKIKVYNPGGLTVFSSDPKQAGEDKRSNAGFVAAAGGRVVSELTHRNTFDAFEGDKTDIDVISSYVPLRVKDQQLGVIEVYQNVTPFVRQIDETVQMLWLMIFGVLGLLYLIQLLVVRHAQAILRRQGHELESANRDLDRRVQERTADLEQAMRRLEGEIADRRSAEQRLDHLAHHDPLTGLPNRLMFNQQLKRSISVAERGSRQLGLLFIDLDRFKDVNDTLGHAVGDELLVAVTQRLAGHLRGGDTLARLGGDEFVCILENISDPHEAGLVAEKLIALLTAPVFVQDHELYVSASIGISLFPGDGEDADVLLRNADAAMYQAKAHGRSQSHFYAPEMTAYAQDRIRLEGLLRRSIEAGELEVHYQIKCSAAPGNAPCGAEALLRWTNAELGSVPPIRFIPVAEETGFIVELGEWVLRQACQQMAAWRAVGIRVPKMSVNLSVKQIERADIVDIVRSALADSGLPAEMLELEITESLIMAVDDAFSILEKLRALGVRLAVDDFGTGYSSLSYLKLLPIHTLKIDRAFIVGIGENSGDEAIVRTVVALAQSLKLSTVAEGVDADHQVSFLRELGCDEIQGFLFGRPVPADEFAAQWRVKSA
jgi:diguanylate cyclase (GGDEF)-like protein